MYICAYALNVAQYVCIVYIYGVVIFSISIRLLCFYGYGKYGNRGSNKKLTALYI